MKKIFRRIGLLLITFALIAAAVKTILVYTNLEQIKAFFSQLTPAPTLPQKNPPPQAKIPDIPMLAMQQGGVAAPTEEQIIEEKQVIAEQVATAGTWLSNPDAQQRHNGAEQLSAYPTPEAEIMLLKALSTDANATVRSAAAESLSAFESLSIPAIAGLLAAMDDKNESVQFSALSTLQKQAFDEEQNPSKHYKMIIHGLKKRQVSTHLSADMRNAVTGFLADQQQ